MRPIEMTDVSQGRITSDSLLVLDTFRGGCHYIRSLINRNASIQSKGGISFPNEIWEMILKIAQKDGGNRYCLVKAVVISSSADNITLQCHAQELDDAKGELQAGDFYSYDYVEKFERYLERATPEEAERGPGIAIPQVRELSGPENTFLVVVDKTPKHDCLYVYPDVPDIISLFEDGGCSVCFGYRFFCPGCMGYAAINFGGMIMDCVSLACPLCMGMNIASKHSDFLEDYYQRPPADEDEAENVRELLQDRLDELGYGIDVPMEAWNAIPRHGAIF